MHALLQSMTARLLLAAAGSALVALFVFVVNPFPSDVYGQTVPGSTLPSAATVPVAERTTTEAAPVTTAPAPPAAGTTTSPAAGTTTSPAANTTTSPATSAATAPVVSAAQQVAVAQQPVALPRTGTGGLDADTAMSTSVAYGFLALAAALTTAAVVHRVRRAR